MLLSFSREEILSSKSIPGDAFCLPSIWIFKNERKNDHIKIFNSQSTKLTRSSEFLMCSRALAISVTNGQEEFDPMTWSTEK